jgi:hypothetical protein
VRDLPRGCPVVAKWWISRSKILETSVDGRNPAPVDRWFIPLFLGFQPSKVVQDFFHQQYHE